MRTSVALRCFKVIVTAHGDFINATLDAICQHAPIKNRLAGVRRKSANIAFIKNMAQEMKLIS